MQITISQQAGHVPVTVLHIRGEVDVNSYEQLQEQAAASLGQGSTNLVLDLTQVTFLSSSGLRAIHQIFNDMRAGQPDEGDEAVRAGVRDGTFHSSHLKLANPNRNVMAALKTAGFDMFLEIHPSVKDAIASF